MHVSAGRQVHVKGALHLHGAAGRCRRPHRREDHTRTAPKHMKTQFCCVLPNLTRNQDLLHVLQSFSPSDNPYAFPNGNKKMEY